MTLTRLGSLLGLFLCVLGSSVSAQTDTSQLFNGVPAQTQAILVMNQERLLRESETGKELLSRERAMTEAHRAEGLRLDQELEAEERDLTEKRKTLPADEFSVLAVDFDTKVVATRRDHNQKSEALATQLENMRKQFFSQVVPIVAAIMQERRAALVFEQRNVLFTGPNVDITDEVIKRLDASEQQAQ